MIKWLKNSSSKLENKLQQQPRSVHYCSPHKHLETLNKYRDIIHRQKAGKQKDKFSVYFCRILLRRWQNIAIDQPVDHPLVVSVYIRAYDSTWLTDKHGA